MTCELRAFSNDSYEKLLQIDHFPYLHSQGSFFPCVNILKKIEKKFSRTNIKALSAGYYSVTYKLSVFS